MNFDGKRGFIGCEKYRNGTPRAHRFMTIPRDVPEMVLIQLFQSDVEPGSSKHPLRDTAKCARVVPCRNGAKGKRVCRE